jgi:hypothetical protein
MSSRTCRCVLLSACSLWLQPLCVFLILSVPPPMSCNPSLSSHIGNFHFLPHLHTTRMMNHTFLHVSSHSYKELMLQYIYRHVNIPPQRLISCFMAFPCILKNLECYKLFHVQRKSDSSAYLRLCHDKKVWTWRSRGQTWTCLNHIIPHELRDQFTLSILEII